MGARYRFLATPMVWSRLVWVGRLTHVYIYIVHIISYIYIQYIDQITLHSSKLDIAMENPPFILKKRKNVDILLKVDIFVNRKLDVDSIFPIAKWWISGHRHV